MLIRFRLTDKQLIKWLAEDLGVSGHGIQVGAKEVGSIVKRLLEKNGLNPDSWLTHMDISVHYLETDVTVTGEGAEFEKICHILDGLATLAN